jgi:SAM-dependent methyltransferase
MLSLLPALAKARHDGIVARETSPDWAEYYKWSSNRQPRPMLLEACERLGTGAGRVAVDLGCGSGTDTLALLDRDWSVMAVDREPVGLARLKTRIPVRHAAQIRVVCAAFADVSIPRAHLVYAGFSLPFCAPRHFPDLWIRIRQALLPGGIFAGQLFGIHDSWAGNPDMTFNNPEEVRGLLRGLEILKLDEIEHDGEAFNGPKHWHMYDILAREPIPTTAHEALSTQLPGWQFYGGPG